ncbi:MAG: c-type cytochrome [Deltaproteobacteria bacterium]|nr:c-type cytochrome [Deltaproteobacteria bacterium]
MKTLPLLMLMLTLVLAGCPNEAKTETKEGASTKAQGQATSGAPQQAQTPTDSAPAPAGGVTEADKRAALEIFSGRCVACHGAQGAGDGPAAAALNPKPASFQSPEWQASVTDQHIEDIIRSGGPAVGKSPLMPPNPDLVEKPNVIAALRAHVRSLKASN